MEKGSPGRINSSRIADVLSLVQYLLTPVDTSAGQPGRSNRRRQDAHRQSLLSEMCKWFFWWMISVVVGCLIGWLH